MKIYLIQTSRGIVPLEESFISFVVEMWLMKGGGYIMDEIEIFFNGVYIFSFFETSLMMCGNNSKNSDLFDVAEKILPSFVWDSFLEYHKHSNWDGDNETKEIKHGIITYRFVNHYWD